jgi:hypothetical protein
MTIEEECHWTTYWKPGVEESSGNINSGSQRHLAAKITKYCSRDFFQEHFLKNGAFCDRVYLYHRPNQSPKTYVGMHAVTFRIR